MFKLMEFITGKKVEEVKQKSGSDTKGGKDFQIQSNRVLPPGVVPNQSVLTKSGSSNSTTVAAELEVAKPRFTKREKDEIRQTLTKFQGSEAHQILLKQLAEHELQNIVNESTDSNDSSDDNSENYGTFCIKDMKNSSDNDNYATFNVKNMGDDDETESYGTMCIGNFGESNNNSNNGTPDFSNMFREPEEWEKYILALEKGEWVDGMAEKGAFKRWQKNRPAMPSAYLRESPIANMMNNANNKK